MSIFLSLLIALIGLLMYGFSANPKLVRIGEIMFGCGLFVFLLRFGMEAVNALGK